MSGEPVKRSLFGRLIGRGTSKPSEPAALPSDEAAALADTVTDRATEPEYDPDVFVILDEPPAEPVVEVAPAPTPVPAPVVKPLPPARAPATEPAPAPKLSWFQRLKAGLTKTSSKLTEGITSVFTKRKLDEDMLQELEDLLIQADLGVETSMQITKALAKGRFDRSRAGERRFKKVGLLGPLTRP